jgi:hypothetical protein
MKVANLAMVLMTAASDGQASNGNDINRWCENDPAIALAYSTGSWTHMPRWVLQLIIARPGT